MFNQHLLLDLDHKLLEHEFLKPGNPNHAVALISRSKKYLHMQFQLEGFLSSLGWSELQSYLM